MNVKIKKRVNQEVHYLNFHLNCLKNAICLVVFIFLLVLNSFCQLTSMFDRKWLATVVLLEKKIGSTYVPHGVGVVINNYEKDKPSIVVTCAHLLRNEEISIVIPITSEAKTLLLENNLQRIELRKSVWNFDGSRLRYSLRLKRDSTFVCNSSLDIAAFYFEIENFIVFNKGNTNDSLHLCNIQSIPWTKMKKKNDVALGMDVYFIGFPFSIGTQYGFGLSGKYMSEVPTPLLRFGQIAWRSDLSSEFLVDGFSFNGNSGSPIFTQIDFLNRTSYFVGMIVGHLQSEKSENYGLANAIWIDDILSLVQKLNKLPY